MNQQLSGRLCRALMASTLVVGIFAVDGSSGLAAPSSPPASTPPSISHLNNSTEHYTIGSDGLIHVRIYNSPAGLSSDPSKDTWHFRAPQLASPIGSSGPTSLVHASDLPFGLDVDTSQPQATLTSEDRITLHVALTTAQAQPVAAQSIQVGATAVTYTLAQSGQPASLTYQPISSGLLARLVIQNPGQGGSLGFTLQTDAQQQASVSQDANGVIEVTHPYQGCGHAGCQTSTAPSFAIEQPIVQDSSDAATRVVRRGSATLGLTADTTGGVITVSLDQTWLHDPARVFPVTVEVPILTSAARAETGVFGTVSSCAPDQPAVASRMVVGTIAGCTYHGIAYFDVRDLLFLEQLPIVGASLHLYTPNASGPTNVQVFQNTPGELLPPPPTATPPTATPDVMLPQRLSSTTSLPVPKLPAKPAIQQHQPLTWANAPAPLTGSTGITETVTQGQWHSWDITSAVQQWRELDQRNTGLTLTAPTAAAPVVFATGLGAAEDGVQVAPYIEITINPQPVQGVARAAGRAGDICYHPCTYNDFTYYPYGVTEGVNRGQDMGYANGLNAELYRFAAQYQDAQHVDYTAVPCNGFAFNGATWQPTYSRMMDIYNQHLVPVVNFIQSQTCSSGSNENVNWNVLLAYFAAYLPNFGTVCIGTQITGYNNCTSNPPMYLEIGNEVDLPQGSAWAQNWAGWYPNDFALAAVGVYDNAPATGYGHPSYTNFHVLTDGIENPGDGRCSNETNVTIAGNALYYAVYDYNVPAQYLGTAVHPYGYMTNEQESGYWQNYGLFAANNLCSNLSYMIIDWRYQMYGSTGSTQPQAPLLISEINYTSVPPTGSCPDITYDIPREGAYQMDLFTWLYDHLGYSSQTGYPVRTTWFAEADANQNHGGCNNLAPRLGIYTWPQGQPYSYQEKGLVSPYTYLGADYYFYCSNDQFNGTWSANLSYLYSSLVNKPCY